MPVPKVGNSVFASHEEDHKLLYVSLEILFFPRVTLPPCRGLWGTLHIGDDIDCNTCPHPGVPRVEFHLFTVGGFLSNSKGMAWKIESMQNMGV